MRYVPEYGIPDGYRKETHYDPALLISGGVSIGVGYGFTLLGAYILQSDARGFIPCVGPFIADSDQQHTGAILGGGMVAVLGCTWQVVGAVVLGVGLANPQDVLVQEFALGDSRLSLAARPQNDGVHLDAMLQF